jgi:arsenite-transporting ATPase
LSGLQSQQAVYAASRDALQNSAQTTMVLVARPETSSLVEAERTLEELRQLGITSVQLILNGVFEARDRSDPIAMALESRGQHALAGMPSGLRGLRRVVVPLLPFGLVGIAALRQMGAPHGVTPLPKPADLPATFPTDTMQDIVAEIAARGSGVVMTMGKGGVGKTTIAAGIATALARDGHSVLLTTTDPAAHVAAAARERFPNLRVARIDPAAETARYSAEVLATAGAGLDGPGRALLEEDLRSPCTEEIAVFRAFAGAVAQGADEFVVIDTAPTGHTLLLLDAAEAYHREVLRKSSGSPEAVQQLLPRLRDASFTHVLLVTLPEATPIHEAMQLERDLARAGIAPMAWVVNQTLTPIAVRDPVLVARQQQEAGHLQELAAHNRRVVLEPWRAEVGGPVARPGSQGRGRAL